MRISSCTRSRRSFRDLASPWITMGSAMMAPMVIRGFREAYGSWKIICMRRRMRRISPAFMRVRACPSKTTSPAGGLVEHSYDAAQGGLAAAAFAHQPQRLAALDLEADAVDGLNVGDLALEDDAGGDGEVHLDVVDTDYGVAGGAGAGGLRC